jgi:integrase
VRKGWAASNPVSQVELPAIAQCDDIRFLEPSEVQAVGGAAAAGPYEAIDRALYITAAMTGLRQGELVALRWARRRLDGRSCPGAREPCPR